MGEVFRRQGYSVEETLGGGADGGVDLALRRGGKLTQVQCKRWKGKPVGVGVVRELFGVMTADGATSGILVTTSTFTSEALAWAREKNIKLVDGAELAVLVKSVQSSRSYSPPEATLPGVCRGVDLLLSCAPLARERTRGINFWAARHFQNADIRRRRRRVKKPGALCSEQDSYFDGVGLQDRFPGADGRKKIEIGFAFFGHRGGRQIAICAGLDASPLQHSKQAFRKERPICPPWRAKPRHGKPEPLSAFR